MKTIQLQSITLRNWRGEQQRTTRFHTDAPTTICGDNGLGKSRHFDAFCWLLFGKDSHDRKDFNLRSYDADHNELHHCECSVEAVLLIDGQPVTLKREYKEQWVKPRGQVDEVFKGNVTECTWDGVPVKVSDYQRRVAQTIIDDTVFKMITNPRYFAGQLKWQQQREVLLQMAGTATDAELAAGNADFRALLDELNGKPLADFRRELAATKKRLKAEAAEIQPRIDQTQKLMPESEDWAALERDANALKRQIADIDSQLTDSLARTGAQQQQGQQLLSEIADLETRQARILREHKQALQAECDQKNERRRSLESNLKQAHAALSRLTIDRNRNLQRIDSLNAEIASTDKQLTQLRQEWYTINSTTYDLKDDICPCCGQPLPPEQREAARRKFADLRASRLADNNKRGRALAQLKAGLQKELAERQAEEETLKAKVETADADIRKFTDAVIATPVAAVPDNADPASIPEWQSLATRVADLRSQLTGLRSATTDADVVARLHDRKATLQQQLEDLQTRLQKVQLIARAKDEIKALTEQGRKLAQQIADVEKREYAATQFSKKKIEDCEQRINSLFHIVRFQLFDTTQDGNEFETCVPLVDGVPYPVANTASQLNAGLDIINTLCRFNNISAPIFVDGAESVNRYTPTTSQVIFLQVSKDKQLVIK